MAVKAIGEYTATPRDVQANFNGMQLLYVYWEKHLMFCAPFTLLVDPGQSFGDCIEQVLKGVIQAHPDTAKIDLSKAIWRLNDRPFAPDYAVSLEANGIDHKSMLRLNTPGLNGIQGSCS